MNTHLPTSEPAAAGGAATRRWTINTFTITVPEAMVARVDDWWEQACGNHFYEGFQPAYREQLDWQTADQADLGTPTEHPVPEGWCRTTMDGFTWGDDWRFHDALQRMLNPNIDMNTYSASEYVYWSWWDGVKCGYHVYDPECMSNGYVDSSDEYPLTPADDVFALVGSLNFLEWELEVAAWHDQGGIMMLERDALTHTFPDGPDAEVNPNQE